MVSLPATARSTAPKATYLFPIPYGRCPPVFSVVPTGLHQSALHHHLQLLQHSRSQGHQPLLVYLPPRLPHPSSIHPFHPFPSIPPTSIRSCPAYGVLRCAALLWAAPHTHPPLRHHCCCSLLLPASALPCPLASVACPILHLVHPIHLIISSPSALPCLT